MSNSDQESAYSFIEALCCLFVLLLLLVSGSSLAAMFQRRTAMYALVQEVRDWQPDAKARIDVHSGRNLRSDLSTSLKSRVASIEADLKDVDGALEVRVLDLPVEGQSGRYVGDRPRQLSSVRGGKVSLVRPGRFQEYIGKELERIQEYGLPLSSPVSLHEESYINHVLYLAIQLCSDSQYWISFEGPDKEIHCLEKMYPLR